MLATNYAGHSPAHPHSQHTPLHAPSAPVHPAQQTQFVHHQHPISSLLPTPPSSPPMIGMHPVESTISLLESLVAFYHQERMWVYRTRAQLEMGLFDRSPDSKTDTELDDSPASPSQLQAQPTSSPDSGKSADSTSSSPQTKWLKRKRAFNLKLEGISSARSMLPPVARGGIVKRPHPHVHHRARQSSNLNPASVPVSLHPSTTHGSTAPHPHPSASLASSNPTRAFYPPTASNAAVTLTSPYLCYPPLQFRSASIQQPLATRVPSPQFASASDPQTNSTAPPSQLQPAQTGPLALGAGGREPAVQILEMFERMMQARMESCERVTRMVREANKPGGIGVGSTGAVGGVNPGSVGGPVGGFGGPVGLPVGIGPQEIIGGYLHVQATTEGQQPQQEFPMGVNVA